MVSEFRWQNPRGLETLRDIVKKLVPAWKHGLTDIQELAVSRILDGEDVLLCTATGSGKSASFAIPILVHQELSRNPAAYPNIRSRKLPVGIVVTPTNGLAANIVSGLKEFGIDGLTYNQETLTEARKAGRSIYEDLNGAEYPPRTHSAKISSMPAPKNVTSYSSGGMASAHASSILAPSSVDDFLQLYLLLSLGFTGDRFHILRRSNERLNTQFIIEVLESAISGNEFPQLLSYISSGRKTIIHCKTINQVFRVYLYLWRMEPSGVNHLRRVRMYHSLCPPTYNTDTLRLLDEDPYCQIVIATIAFANGINVKTLLDSITIGWSDTLAITWQEKGRVGRDDKSDGRGVCLVPKSTFKAAKNHLNGNTSKSSKQQTDDAAARVLTEKLCLIAAVNREFKNPPPEISTLDCIEAKRRLPCSLCCKRAGIILRFHAPDDPPDTEMPEPFPQAEVPPSTPKKRSKAAPDQLKKKEKEASRERLLAFDAAVWTAERNSPSERNRPRSSFFPAPLVNRLLASLLKISSLEDLDAILSSESWPFIPTQHDALFAVISQIQREIQDQRKTSRRSRNAKQRAKRRGGMDSPIPSDNEDTRSPSPLSPNPEITAPEPLNAPSSPPPSTLPQKRKALEDVTNKVPRKRAPQLS
ncbi:uncharacterized protein ARMOST_16951 [Armillaria ostoyae]|uniref:DNA 3'-5' helicase n=1 Tax=Armillaria ostoyae TaxID=47428 RepID=A0A284RXN1_ARMOS|nr:uncharacterized protein ARMOST_16951 [Armillaria ostoyae]